MNIGAGRIVKQDLPRLNEAAANGSLASHPELRALSTRMQAAGGHAFMSWDWCPRAVCIHIRIT